MKASQRLNLIETSYFEIYLHDNYLGSGDTSFDIEANEIDPAGEALAELNLAA